MAPFRFGSWHKSETNSLAKESTTSMTSQNTCDQDTALPLHSENHTLSMESKVIDIVDAPLALPRANSTLPRNAQRPSPPVPPTCSRRSSPFPMGSISSSSLNLTAGSSPASIHRLFLNAPATPTPSHTRSSSGSGNAKSPRRSRASLLSVEKSEVAYTSSHDYASPDCKINNGKKMLSFSPRLNRRFSDITTSQDSRRIDFFPASAAFISRAAHLRRTSESRVGETMDPLTSLTPSTTDDSVSGTQSNLFPSDFVFHLSFNRSKNAMDKGCKNYSPSATINQQGLPHIFSLRRSSSAGSKIPKSFEFGDKTIVGPVPVLFNEISSDRNSRIRISTSAPKLPLASNEGEVSDPLLDEYSQYLILSRRLKCIEWLLQPSEWSDWIDEMRARSSSPIHAIDELNITSSVPDSDEWPPTGFTDNFPLSLNQLAIPLFGLSEKFTAIKNNVNKTISDLVTEINQIVESEQNNLQCAPHLAHPTPHLQMLLEMVSISQDMLDMTPEYLYENPDTCFYSTRQMQFLYMQSDLQIDSDIGKCVYGLLIAFSNLSKCLEIKTAGTTEYVTKGILESSNNIFEEESEDEEGFSGQVIVSQSNDNENLVKDIDGNEFCGTEGEIEVSEFCTCSSLTLASMSEKKCFMVPSVSRGRTELRNGISFDRKSGSLGSENISNTCKQKFTAPKSRSNENEKSSRNSSNSSGKKSITKESNDPSRTSNLCNRCNKITELANLSNPQVDQIMSNNFRSRNFERSISNSRPMCSMVDELNQKPKAKTVTSVFELSLQGRFRYVSPLFAQILERKAEEISEMHVSEIFSTFEHQLFLDTTALLCEKTSKNEENSSAIISLEIKVSKAVVKLEIQGVLARDSIGNPSHTIWMCTKEVDYILCHLCERQVSEFLFSKHTDICKLLNKAILDLSMARDNTKEFQTTFIFNQIDADGISPSSEEDNHLFETISEVFENTEHIRGEVDAFNCNLPVSVSYCNSANDGRNSLFESPHAVATSEICPLYVPKCFSLLDNCPEKISPKSEVLFGEAKKIIVELIQAHVDLLIAKQLNFCLLKEEQSFGSVVEPSRASSLSRHSSCSAPRRSHSIYSAINSKNTEPSPGNLQSLLVSNQLISSSGTQRSNSSNRNPEAIIQPTSNTQPGIKIRRQVSRLKRRVRPPELSLSSSGSKKTHSPLVGSPLAPFQPFLPASEPSTDDYIIIKPISKGAFGSVHLAKKVLTGEYFAIKVLLKADMISKNQVANIKAERLILMLQPESEFVAKLYVSFQSRNHLYLVMEYMNGGDCAAMLKAVGLLPEIWAKAYVAEMVLILEHLHSRGIVHRDLKPDNFLIHKTGHLKLTDFGLSRIGFLGRRRDPADGNYSKTQINKHGQTNAANKTVNYLCTDLAEDEQYSPVNKSLQRLSICSIGSSSHNLSETSEFNSSNQSECIIQDYMTNWPNGNPHVKGQAQLQHDGGSSSPLLTQFLLNSRRNSSNSLAYVDSIKTKHGNGSISPKGEGDSSHVSAKSKSFAKAQQSNPSANHKNNFCGTPDYLAPESILGTDQDNSTVDWWALGIILFEFLYGVPPFHANTVEEVFQNIMRNKIKFPVTPVEGDGSVSIEAKDLIRKLLVSDPEKRLGRSGASAVKSHPFFSTIDWEHLRECEPAFVPKTTDIEDTTYFDPRGVKESSENNLQEKLSSDELTEKPDFLEALAADFGSFSFRNLDLLEKANHTTAEKLRSDRIQQQQIKDNEELIIQHAQGGDFLEKQNTGELNYSTKTLKYDIEPARPRVISFSSPVIPQELIVNGVPPPSPYNSNMNILENDETKECFKSNSLLSNQNLPNFEVLRGVQSARTQRNNAEAHRVLICDENPVSRRILETILARLGCICFCVPNGDDAVRVATGSMEFSIIFVDLKLPIIDGENVALIIKSTENVNRLVPIVGLTAYEIQLQTNSRLFSHFLSKPLRHEVIAEIMDSI